MSADDVIACRKCDHEANAAPCILSHRHPHRVRNRRIPARSGASAVEPAGPARPYNSTVPPGCRRGKALVYKKERSGRCKQRPPALSAALSPEFPLAAADHVVVSYRAGSLPVCRDSHKLLGYIYFVCSAAPDARPISATSCADSFTCCRSLRRRTIPRPAGKHQPAAHRARRLRTGRTNGVNERGERTTGA
jgi:hypothetical protein